MTSSAAPAGDAPVAPPHVPAPVPGTVPAPLPNDAPAPPSRAAAMLADPHLWLPVLVLAAGVAVLARVHG